jgi:predicted KAP-like P-loop ATPase
MSSNGTRKFSSSRDLNVLSADNPLTDPESDRLGYAPFAKNLADSICKMSPPDGFVMAVYAPWGSGKSTLLNFIVHYLEQESEEIKPLIFRFNPWWFSGQEELTRYFFDEFDRFLSSNISWYRKTWLFVKRIWKCIRKFLTNVFKALVQAQSPSAPRAQYEFLANFFEINDSNAKTIYDLKKAIKKELNNHKTLNKIVVFIDDIDRLTAEEIRQLFQLIKVVLDLPKITYFLAFDKDVVIKALETSQEISGEDYLEKIVQVPFELPLPDRDSLFDMLDQTLQNILDETPPELFDRDYWKQFQDNILKNFIAKPRDIYRLTNALRVTYPIVKGEVNAVDFIAIEVLRVFCPVAYNNIRTYPNRFITRKPFTPRQSSEAVDIESLEDRDFLQKFHESWIKEIKQEHRNIVKRLIITLFPSMKKVFERFDQAVGSFYYIGEEGEQYQKLHINAKNIFPCYFKLAVSNNIFPHNEFNKIIETIKDEIRFKREILNLLDHPNRESFFRKLINKIHSLEIPKEELIIIINSFFDIGDQFIFGEIDKSSLDRNRSSIDEIKIQLQKEAGERVLRKRQIVPSIIAALGKYEENKAFEILKYNIQNSESISTIIDLISVLDCQQGKYRFKGQEQPSDSWIFDSEHLENLELIAVKKIQDIAGIGRLTEIPDLCILLEFWMYWSNEDEVKTEVQKISSTDKGILHLLTSAVWYRVDYDISFDLRNYFSNTAQIIDRIRRLENNEELTEMQKIAVQEFIRTKVAIRNPSLDCLNDPEEDIYTLEDGEPFHE